MSQLSTHIAINAAYGRMFRHENGIIYLYVDNELSIDIPEAQQLVQDVQSLDNSGKARFLIVQGSNNDMTFSAQKYLGTVEGVTHLALVVQSRLQAEVARFFMSMMSLLHSPYELRVFHQLEQAENWLLSI